MDWKKGRKFRDVQEKYEPGTVLKNGRMVPFAPAGSLAARAARAELEWVKAGRKPTPKRRRS